MTRKKKAGARTHRAPPAVSPTVSATAFVTASATASLTACLLLAATTAWGAEAGEAPASAPAIDFEAPAPRAEIRVPYPEAALSEGVGGTVVLFLDVSISGEVTAVRTHLAIDERLAAAAEEALAKTSFEPARIAGDATAWRMEAAVTFDATDGSVAVELTALGRASAEPDPAHADSAESSPVSAPSPPPGAWPVAGGGKAPKKWDDEPKTPPAPPAGGRIRILGPAHAESAGMRGYRNLSADPADWIRELPGLVVLRLPGVGRAPLVAMAGSAMTHGTEIATTVDGLPQNLPGHVTGSGYVDLAYLFPELVEGVDLEYGPFNGRDASYATGGSLSLTTARDLERTVASVSLAYPPFASVRGGLARALVLATPELGRNSSAIVGAQGFLDQGHTEAASAGRYALLGSVRYGPFSATATSHAATWSSPGLIPDSADFDRTDAFDGTDGGATSLHQLVLRFDGSTPGSGGAGGATLALYAGLHRFTLYENRTGFLRSACPGICFGDQFELDDRRGFAGLMGRWRTSGRLLAGVRLKAELGIDARYDAVELARWSTTSRERLEATGHWRTGLTNLNAYARAELRFWGSVTAGATVRADFMLFDVEDQLENPVPGAPTSGVAGFALAAPSVWILATPHPVIEIFARGGLGFRPPDPRVVPARIPGMDAANPARTLAGEAGIRLRPVDGLEIVGLGTAAVWERQTGYDPVLPAPVTLPAGRRLGGAVSVRYALRKWLNVDASFSLARARVRPVEGAPRVNLAGAPTWAGWVALVAQHPTGVAGMVRTRMIGPRALTEDSSETSRATVVVDVSAGFHRKFYSVVLLVENVVGLPHDDAQLYYRSAPLADGSGGAEARHFTPGGPLTVSASLQVRF